MYCKCSRHSLASCPQAITPSHRAGDRRSSEPTESAARPALDRGVVMDTETLLRRVDPAHLIEIPGPDSPQGLRIRNQVLSGRPVPEAARNTKTRRALGFSVGALTTVAAALVLLLVVLPT